MPRVYGLKHATPKMKYQHMNMVLEWRADLKEKQGQQWGEPTDVPDAIYWRRGAERAYNDLSKMFPEDRTEQFFRLLTPIWKEENTWMHIFDRTRHACDLLESISKSKEPK